MGFKNFLRRLKNRARRDYFGRKGVQLAGAVNVSGKMPLIHLDGTIELGDGVIFMCRQAPRIVLGSHANAKLSIGAGTFINQSSSIIASVGITIGKNAKIGPLVTIHDTSYHEVDQGVGTVNAKIVIGDNVWLGRGSTILPGVTIGDHSVVGAGSIVTKSVPARTVVAGNPARIIREVVADDGYIRP